MLATVVSAGVTIVGALMFGQSILRLCGTQGFSWTAAPVGLSVLLMVAITAIHVPGHSTTVAVVIFVLLVAALAAAVRDPALRPPVVGLLAGLPALVLVAVPFLAAGHAGTLGVSLDNDMRTHLLIADALRYPQVAAVSPLTPSYPIGPHALAAVLGQGLHADTDLTFAGVTAAVPVLLALTTLAALSPGADVVPSAALATAAGVPYLVAGYYGQGGFKEIMQALFVLGFTLELRRLTTVTGRLRWLPAALVVGGILSVYSLQGLLWPAAILAVFTAGQALTLGARGSVAALRQQLAALAIAAVVVLLALVPQLPRIWRFYTATVGLNGTGTAKNNLGNLVAPISLREASGIWDNDYYTLPAQHPALATAAALLVAALAVVGAVWWVRRGDWLVPAGAVVCLAIWAFTAHTQSPYLAAKALVICSPLVLVVALRPPLEGDWGAGVPRWWALLAPVLAVAVVAAVVNSSWDALRISPVGPRAHVTELRALRPLLGRGRTVFLGDDDFIFWELAGVPVDEPQPGGTVPIRPQKPYAIGQPLDLDSLDTSALDGYRWVVTTRDAAGSAPPEGLKLVRETRDFALYRRTGTVQPVQVLAEGDAAAAALDCTTAQGRALARSTGVAQVRPASMTVPVPSVGLGRDVAVRLPLGAGTWELETPYVSPAAVDVSAPRLRATLPPSLDRPGPRYPVGRIHLAAGQTVTVRVHAHRPLLAPASNVAILNTLVATPVVPDRAVPLRQACGQLVDSYRLESAR